MDASHKWKPSARQWRVLKSSGIEFLGMDANRRPVVGAMSGIPQTYRRWSVKRDGDPTDIAEPVEWIKRIDDPQVDERCMACGYPMDGCNC